MTPEQEKALALARARKRKAQASAQPVAPQQPVAAQGVMSSQSALATAPTQAQDAATNPYTQADTQYDPVTGAPIAGSFANSPTTVTDQEVGVPEGMFFNPQTGQYTSRELLANNMQPGTATSGIAGAAQGATFGFADEGMGILEGALGLGEGTPAQDAKYAKEWTRAMLDASRREHPVAAYGGEVAGAMLTPGAAAKTTEGAGLGVRMGVGALTGATQGGLYGAGAAEDGSRADGAITGAKWGGAIGGAIPALGAVGSKIYDALKQNSAIKMAAANAPSTEELRKMGSDAFGALRAQNVNVPQSQFPVGAILGQMDDAGLDMGGAVMPSLTPKAGRVAEMVQGVANDPSYSQGIPFEELMKLRRHAGTAAGDIANKTESAVGSAAIGGIDDAIDALPGTLGDDYKVARDLWARMSRSGTIDNAIEAGGNYLSGASSGIKNQFKNILKNPKLSRGFSDLEKRAMKKVVDGSIPQKLVNMFGSGLGQMATMGAGIGIGATAGPVASMGGAALGAGVGLGARKLSEKMTTNAAEVVRALIANGGLSAAQTTNPQVRAIIEALMRNGSIAGTVGGQQ